MKVPRFQVATCEGWPIHLHRLGGSSGRRLPGLSATVCDTWRAWEEVKTYRSEDRGGFGVQGGYRGKEKTMGAATEHAERLNQLYGGD